MDKLSESSPRLRELFERVDEFAQGLGEEVTRKVNKNYVVSRRLKNFACP